MRIIQNNMDYKIMYRCTVAENRQLIWLWASWQPKWRVKYNKLQDLWHLWRLFRKFPLTGIKTWEKFSHMSSHRDPERWHRLTSSSSLAGLFGHFSQLLVQCCKYKCLINVWLTDLMQCLGSYSAHCYFNSLVSKLVLISMVETRDDLS